MCTKSELEACWACGDTQTLNGLLCANCREPTRAQDTQDALLRQA